MVIRANRNDEPIIPKLKQNRLNSFDLIDRLIDDSYKVVDVGNVEGEVYLLTTHFFDDEVVIFHVACYDEFIQMPSRRVFKIRQELEDSKCWTKGTSIIIQREGVKIGSPKYAVQAV